MTNYEHYKNEIERITRLGLTFGIDKETEKIDVCFNQTCEDCKFYAQGSCVNNKIKWVDKEYVEPEVDWAKVAVDTPILVRNATESDWEHRHFAKYEDGKVYAWNDGLTSFTIYNSHFVTWWSYAKLAEVE